jgi:uncharacterized repeat protein (TIGR01451 family)
MLGLSDVLNVGRKVAVVIVPLAVIAFVAAGALSASAASPSADLATTMRAYGSNVLGGYDFYAITVTNSGPDAASDVIMTDNIPLSMWTRYPTTFVRVGSNSTFAPLPQSVSCTTPRVGSTGTVSCTTGSLASGAAMTVWIEIRTGFYINNQLFADTASVISSTFDPNTNNNTATVWIGHRGPIG